MEEFNYRVSDDAVELAKHHEGFRARAYLDPIGIPTIGYGLTRYFHRPGAPRVKMGDVITEDEASFALAGLNPFEFRAGLKHKSVLALLKKVVLIPLNSGLA